jgi:ferredoxin
MAKVTVDQKTCIGCESCSAMCPKVFEVKNGKSKPKMKEVKGADEECAKNAVAACPTNSIKVQ